MRGRRRIPLVCGALLSFASAQLLVGGPLTARAAAVIQGSCYDALYFDGLTSRYAANHCASALNQAGYAGTAYHNTSAQTALQNSLADSVFFHAGHSLDFFDSSGHSGVGLMYEAPDQNGDLDALASDPIAAADMTGALVGVCSEGGGCRSQNVFVGYPWADTPQIFKANLVVLEACATAQDTASWVSLATTAFDAGAGTTVGFVQDISFSVNQDESNLYGDGWANRFWSDAAAGESYAASVVDASNSVGNAYGYGSYVILQNPGAPTSLYPAQYFL
jgi:hypothetical protein